MNPPGERRIPGTPESWLAHADSDMQLALLGRSNENILPEQVCFHAQQAAEKAIKCVLLLSKTDFPLIHDIEALLEIADNAGIDIPDNIRVAGVLTPYAVELRYPGPWEQVADADADAALAVAEHVVVWAKKQCEVSG